VAAIYLFTGDSQAGPFTTPQIQAMFQEGTIGSDALYWQEGMEEWRHAQELRPPGTI
jgi:hypothetical protein